MLAATGILTAQDLADIERGLAQVRAEIADGTFAWSLDHEDVHLNIERRLTAARRRRRQAPAHRRARATTRSPPTCGCGCAARSTRSPAQLVALRRAFIDLAEQPRRHDHAGLHAPAGRAAGDLRPSPARLRRDVRARHASASPTAASASTACRWAPRRWPARRFRSTARASRASWASTSVAGNSLDAVSDRDFAIEFEAAAALVMIHLSRFAEELVLWSSPRFGFVALADRFCTGSSIMPQKKNPDVPGARARQERPRDRPPRGAAGADEGAAAHLQQGQPGRQGAAVRHGRHAGRHARDHDRPRGDAASRVQRRAHARRRRAKDSRPRPTSPTTSCAAAHRSGTRTKPSRAPCATPKRRAWTLPALPVAELRQFSPLVGDDVHEVLTLEGSVASRDHAGGTAPSQVRAAAAAARRTLP